MNFLSIGKKLENLRKKLKMRQQDLVGDNITRGFISMIEIDKRVPNRDVAKYLTDKFKSRAKELGITLNIDDLYLTRDAREEAEFYCVSTLQTASLKCDIEQIIKIAEDYSLNNV
jgi:HTH-type transcriptional regulator, quorum sensing regulator NprR